MADDVFEFLPAGGRFGEGRAGWTLKAGSRHFALNLPSATVGREPDCEICLPEVGVSRRHARFTWEADRLQVVDLASFGGVMINGVFQDVAELHGGEVLGLGPVQVEVLSPG
jgi:pSer/pThr/pTyr-binding forkhead associated (FHA) protein